MSSAACLRRHLDKEILLIVWQDIMCCLQVTLEALVLQLDSTVIVGAALALSDWLTALRMAAESPCFRPPRAIFFSLLFHRRIPSSPRLYELNSRRLDNLSIPTIF